MNSFAILILLGRTLAGHFMPSIAARINVDQLLEEKERTTHDRLDEFKTAAENGDTKTLRELLQTLEDIMRHARLHTLEVRGIPDAVEYTLGMFSGKRNFIPGKFEYEWLEYVSRKSASDKRGNFETLVMDGESLTTAIFNLETVKEWIYLRTSGTFDNSKLKKQLEDIAESIEWEL